MVFSFTDGLYYDSLSNGSVFTTMLSVFLTFSFRYQTPFLTSHYGSFFPTFYSMSLYIILELSTKPSTKNIKKVSTFKYTQNIFFLFTVINHSLSFNHSSHFWHGYRILFKWFFLEFTIHQIFCCNAYNKNVNIVFKKKKNNNNNNKSTHENAKSFCMFIIILYLQSTNTYCGMN
jgi:hypothetical protein